MIIMLLKGVMATRLWEIQRYEKDTKILEKDLRKILKNYHKHYYKKSQIRIEKY